MALIAKINKFKAQNGDAEEELKRMLDYDHRSIVKGLDGFIEKIFTGLLYVAILEYCDGGDLEDFIKEHGGKEELMPVYLRLFYEMADAVAYMHDGKRKHMHRDLKPPNILLMFP